MRVDRADAVRELVQPELAEEHRARLAKLAYDRRVRLWDPVREDARAGCRADPFRREEVLDRDGNAVQRTSVPARRDLICGFARLRARDLRGHGHERVKARVDLFDARETRLGQLRRRDASIAYAGGGVLEREVDGLADGGHERADG